MCVVAGSIYLVAAVLGTFQRKATAVGFLHFFEGFGAQTIHLYYFKIFIVIIADNYPAINWIIKPDLSPFTPINES